MKFCKELAFSALLIGTVLSISLGDSAKAATATTYPDALNANATGNITFQEEEDDNVPSPVDPDSPVVPDDPLNPAPGELKIVYASPFDFGTHKKSIYGLEAYAAGVSVTDSDAAKSKTIPFVTTKDMRVDRGNGWTLSAKASKFTDGTHVIDGAYMSLIGASYATGDTTNAANRPSVASTSIDLAPGTSVPIASSDTSSNASQGLGLYSLALGTTLDTNDLTDGVKFTLPINTAVNNTTYTSQIVWTIAPKL